MRVWHKCLETKLPLVDKDLCLARWFRDDLEGWEFPMFEISLQLRVPEEEFAWSFARSGGPGGQNVNKVASKAVLRWDVAKTQSLPVEIKSRLRAQQANRITSEGVLIITSQHHRDQERNRQDCLGKLRAMILRAAVAPKKRRPTRPTRGSKERRLQAKKRRAKLKTGRRAFPSD